MLSLLFLIKFSNTFASLCRHFPSGRSNIHQPKPRSSVRRQVPPLQQLHRRGRQGQHLVGERRHLDAHVHVLRTPHSHQLSSLFAAVASGTGRRERGWTTSTMETPVTPASRPWSTSTDTTALYSSPQQVGHAQKHAMTSSQFRVQNHHGNIVPKPFTFKN